jgi:hypothetical protein
MIFSKNESFLSHRKSNVGDLTLRYDYLYSLSHKVLAEALLISAKRKHDPDATMNDYMATGVKN